MKAIIVTTTIRTTFELPDDVSLEDVRAEILSELSEDETPTDEVGQSQERAVKTANISIDAVYQSVEHRVSED